MKSRLLTCSLRSLHDGVFVEDARDAAAQLVPNTATEQVRDATAEQRKQQMAERARPQEQGAKRREDEPALPIGAH